MPDAGSALNVNSGAAAVPVAGAVKLEMIDCVITSKLPPVHKSVAVDPGLITIGATELPDAWNEVAYPTEVGTAFEIT